MCGIPAETFTGFHESCLCNTSFSASSLVQLVFVIVICDSSWSSYINFFHKVEGWGDRSLLMTLFCRLAKIILICYISLHLLFHWAVCNLPICIPLPHPYLISQLDLFCSLQKLTNTTYKIWKKYLLHNTIHGWDMIWQNHYKKQI